MTVTYQRHARPLPRGVVIQIYQVTVAISCLGVEPQKLVVDAVVTPPSVSLWNAHVYETHYYLDVNELTREDRDVIRAAVIQAHLKGSRS